MIIYIFIILATIIISVFLSNYCMIEYLNRDYISKNEFNNEKELIESDFKYQLLAVKQEVCKHELENIEFKYDNRYGDNIKICQKCEKCFKNYWDDENQFYIDKKQHEIDLAKKLLKENDYKIED